MNPDDPRWDLVRQYIQGNASSETIAELTVCLRADASFRAAFLEYLNVDLALSLAQEARDAGVPMPAAPRRSFGYRKFALAAGILIAVASLVLLNLRSDRPADPLATIVTSIHGQWSTGGEVADGEVLMAGTHEFQSGLIELRMSSGTTLIVQAPASVELSSPLSARLAYGNVVVRMPRGQSGFVVETPQMVVTDLGTELGVSVSSDSGSRVQVFDGAVRAEAGLHEPRQLMAGDSLQAGLDGTFQSSPFDAELFVRRLPPVPPRTMPSGVLYSKSSVHEVSLVRRQPPRIDGDLSDWNRAHAFRSACLPPYDQSYFIEGFMGYDEENLYLAAHVGDPEPMRNRSQGPLLFAGGSVIVRLAADRNLGWPLQAYSESASKRLRMARGDADNPGIISLVLTYDAVKEEPALTLQYGLSLQKPDATPPGWHGAFRRDANGRGYTLEYSIPWRFFHCEANLPRPGDALPCLWTVHWSDTEGRICRGQLIDVTNEDPQASLGISPANFFQYGPCWGRARVIGAEKN